MSPNIQHVLRPVQIVLNTMAMLSSFFLLGLSGCALSERTFQSAWDRASPSQMDQATTAVTRKQIEMILPPGEELHELRWLKSDRVLARTSVAHWDPPSTLPTTQKAMLSGMIEYFIVEVHHESAGWIMKRRFADGESFLCG